MEKLSLALYLYSILFYKPTPELVVKAREIAEILGDDIALSVIDELGYEGLLREYSKAFKPGSRGRVCAPYESYYREGLIYGDTSVELRKHYKSRGYELLVEGELPDHIAVELEYASITLDKEIIRRIKTWLPRLVEDLKNCSMIYAKLGENLLRILEETPL
ncbi:MAG: molecular chaperone TorD family protein [Acidilobaceae archaeon]